MRKLLKLVAVMAAVLSSAVAIGADTAKRAGDISAPVVYKDLMLVMTNGEGTAAVIFTDHSERGIKYKFRYESKDGKSKSGEGAVFEKYENGRYAGGDLFVEAGPIRLGWSNSTPERGWIYYNPEKLKVQIAHAKFFEDRIEVRFGERHEFKKLDLKRFMK